MHPLYNMVRIHRFKEEIPMPNNIITRIDNRPVHGRVATRWCGAIGANLILIANDEVADNKMRQGLVGAFFGIF